MSKLKINNKMPQFKRSVVNKLQIALREMGSEALRDSRSHAPFLHGALRGNSDIKFTDVLQMEISHYEKYAHFQHEGGDSKRTVRKYTHAGVGKKFLENAGRKQQAKFVVTVRKHLKGARTI